MSEQTLESFGPQEASSASMRKTGLKGYTPHLDLKKQPSFTFILIYPSVLQELTF